MRGRRAGGPASKREVGIMRAAFRGSKRPGRRPGTAPATLALAALCSTAGAGREVPVQVILDMDAAAAGIQSAITVPAATTCVPGLAVYIRDPLGERVLWSIGYRGGFDRGIAFGHMPDEAHNAGRVLLMTTYPGTPVNPANTPWTVEAPYFDPGFIGPETHYLEFGAEAPAMIPAEPSEPVFTADIVLDGAQMGDRFAFYLLDFVVVWNSGGEHGAFSTQGPNMTLDTGGDVVPDGTETIYGVDPDPPLPVPPASFTVDYIDGPVEGGGAVIVVVAKSADLNGDGAVNVPDLLILLGAWGPCEDGGDNCPADLDGDGEVGAGDLMILLANWGSR
jgi:hypothetical protein